MFIEILALILMGAIFIRVIFSWIRMDPNNQVAIFLQEITEPILAPIRRFMPRLGMLDLTPMVAIFILYMIISFVGKLP
jgi:YggT family protein